jgi:hypothetical protein
MTQSPSVCGSVLYDSYVNDAAQQPMVWRAGRIGFHRYFFSRFRTASTIPDPSAIANFSERSVCPFQG